LVAKLLDGLAEKRLASGADWSCQSQPVDQAELEQMLGCGKVGVEALALFAAFDPRSGAVTVAHGRPVNSSHLAVGAAFAGSVELPGSGQLHLLEGRRVSGQRVLNHARATFDVSEHCDEHPSCELHFVSFG